MQEGCGDAVQASEPQRAGEPPQAGEPQQAGLPGWYPDPDGARRLRWWDGSQWTWQVLSGHSVEWAPPPEPRPEAARSLPGLGTAVAGFAVAAALGLLAQLLLWVAGRPGGAPVELGLSEVGLWSGLVGSVWLVSRRRGTGSLRSDYPLTARPVDLAFGLAGSLAGRAMAAGAVAPFTAFLLHQKESVDQQTLGSVARGAVGWSVLVAVTCVGAPLVEELFFRGLVQTRLVARWGTVPGIVATSVLFGAAHLIGWAGPISLLYAWGIAAAGLALGTLRHLTGRLGTSMAAHALFNAQALAVLAATGVIR